MKNMRKAVSLLLMLLLAAPLLSGCTLMLDDAVQSHTRDIRVANGYVASDKNAQELATLRELAILDNMDLSLENEYFALYLGAYHDIAVRDKITGKVFLSGDALYDANGEPAESAAMKLAASQLSIEYYDKNSIPRAKSSYPDCYMDESIQQVQVEKGEDFVRVTYSLGQRNDQFVIPPVLTSEAYLRFKSEAQELSSQKVITKNAMGQFVRAYRKVSVATLPENEKQEYAGKYVNIAELGTVYVLMPDLTDKQKSLVSAVATALKIDADFIRQQEELVGVSSSADSGAHSSESDYFVIPVVYRFDQGDLTVTVETAKIQYTPGTHLTKVYVLNTFAAGGTKEDGYIFLPDGSGTVIANNTSVYGMTQLDVPFYGHDFGVSYDSFSTLAPYAPMPVFGIKRADSAVFAIVEGSDAMAGVQGRAGLTTFAYCSAYPYFNYYTRDYLNRTSNVYAYSQVLPTEEFMVRYHFLYGGDANYSGMARYYRTYLEQTGVLTRIAGQRDMKLNLRLFGAINKVVRTMGIPIKQVVPATTFAQGREILKTLHDAGILSADIIYSEIMNGAREYKAPSRIDIQNELGGLNGYNDFVSYANSMGYGVFPSVDFGKVYKKGNGISRSDDVILTISRNDAVIYDGITLPPDTVAASFVNPLRYESLVSSFLEDRKKLSGSGAYLPTLGYFLSGNYNEKSGLTRTESQILTAGAIKKLSDAGLECKLDGGNAYLLSGADSLINVELDSSMSRLETYAVPFTAMVLKGYIPFAGPPINNSDEYERMFLKTLENGADLHYEIMAADSFLLADTEYTDMYSVGADIWLNSIMEKYKQLNGEFHGLANERIGSHQRLSDGVFETTYENGVRVIVNYSDSLYESGSVQVAPLGYAIVRP